MRYSLFFIMLYSIVVSAQGVNDSIKTGNLNEIKELNELIEKWPTADNFYYRGYSYFAIKDYQNALLDYNKAIAIDSTDFKYFFSRGKLKDEVKDYRGAVLDYTTCIALNKISYKAYYSRAFSKSNYVDLYGAIEDYSKCIEINPDYGPAYLNRGIVKAQKHLHEDAIKDFDKAISLNVSFIETMKNRAISKALLNRKDAIDDFNAVVQSDQKNGEGYYNRALHIINFKLKQDYCSDLKKANQLGFIPAKKLLNQYCKL